MKKKVSFMVYLVKFLHEFDALKEKHSNPPPRPYIQEFNNFGKLRVGFTRPIQVPTFDLYPEFTQDAYFSKNCSHG